MFRSPTWQEYGSMDTYTLEFRVVRFPLSDSSYECIVTNLPADFPYGNQFSPQQGHYVDPDPACGLAQENPADMGGG